MICESMITGRLNLHIFGTLMAAAEGTSCVRHMSSIAFGAPSVCQIAAFCWVPGLRVAEPRRGTSQDLEKAF